MSSIPWLLLALGLAGCGDREVEVYRVPKRPAPPVARSPVPAPPSASPFPGGGLAWDVPAGWTSRPGAGMRHSTFLVPAGGAPPAELSVVVLPGSAGGALANVNRWRGQIGLPPLDDPGLRSGSTQLGSAAGALLVVDFEGEDPSRTRLLGAILERPDQTWFFKLAAPRPSAAAAKPAFLKFLGSLRRG